MSGAAASQRLGLFGGSFDPVHDAHLALATGALDALALDRVLWIPVGTQPQKAHAITAAEHREAMVRLAIEGEPRFALERIELERAGPSYTIDTVRALQARHPGAMLILVIGADQYARLHTWAHWAELLSRVTLAVARRPGVAVEAPAEVERHAHRLVPLPMLDISSTEIRDRAARGQAIDHLVPAQVARYIARHGLYRSGSAPIRS